MLAMSGLTLLSVLRGLFVRQATDADAQPLHLSTDQGFARDYYLRGVRYDDGDGVPQDSAEAVRCYRFAAEKGDANAQFSLAEMYDMGRGVVQDDAEAVRWYRRAADQGHVQAQHNLGVAYALGSSVPEDLVAAYMWLSLAADRASADDRDIWVAERDTEAKVMTPEQIAEAERLAREWKPTQPSR